MINIREVSSLARGRVIEKIRKRFGADYRLNEEIVNFELSKVCVSRIPSNFKVLFAFAGLHCTCHDRRLTAVEMFSHVNLDFGAWFATMTELDENEVRANSKQTRRRNMRLIAEIVKKVGQLSYQKEPLKEDN